MMYAVLLEDDDNYSNMRARYMSEHLAFLQRNADTIEAAGPLQDTSDGAPAGGLWLVKTDRVKDVCALIEADPFWPTGLRKSYRILEWKQVFAKHLLNG